MTALRWAGIVLVLVGFVLLSAGAEAAVTAPQFGVPVAAAGIGVLIAGGVLLRRALR